jgi:5'-deoxynucleotidase YfbR-like HD superfamily hydrolase
MSLKEREANAILANSEDRSYPFNLVYRLNNIIRYANVPRISKESVTVHLYHVAAIVMELYTKYDFNLEKALVMALSHDIPETEIDDISHSTKSKFPDVAKALKSAESALIKEYPSFMCDAIQEFEDGNTLEAKIVQIADADQCSQFANYEINHLGNSSEQMKFILKYSQERVDYLKNTISEFKRG